MKSETKSNSSKKTFFRRKEMKRVTLLFAAIAVLSFCFMVEVAQAAKAFNATYMKLEFPSPRENQEDAADYGMGHSATTYLVGPNGTVIATYSRKTRPQDMAAGIIAAMGGHG